MEESDGRERATEARPPGRSLDAGATDLDLVDETRDGNGTGPLVMRFGRSVAGAGGEGGWDRREGEGVRS